jgi:ABC-type multidrug transport system fused ATPase/permease subunit
MDNGSVVEMGQHEELLQRGGVYARLINAQVEQKQPPLPQTG